MVLFKKKSNDFIIICKNMLKNRAIFIIYMWEFFKNRTIF